MTNPAAETMSIGLPADLPTAIGSHQANFTVTGQLTTSILYAIIE